MYCIFRCVVHGSNEMRKKNRKTELIISWARRWWGSVANGPAMEPITQMKGKQKRTFRTAVNEREPIDGVIIIIISVMRQCVHCCAADGQMRINRKLAHISRIYSSINFNRVGPSILCLRVLVLCGSMASGGCEAKSDRYCLLLCFDGPRLRPLPQQVFV